MRGHCRKAIQGNVGQTRHPNRMRRMIDHCKVRNLPTGAAVNAGGQDLLPAASTWDKGAAENVG